MKIVIRKDAFVGPWQIVGDKPLGEGGNSVVWQAKSEDGRDVAIKFLFERLLTTSRYGRFVDEVTFHKTLGVRKGILPLVDSYLPVTPSVSDRPWLVTQLATPLVRALSDMPNDLRHIVESFQVIASTLKQIHDEGAAHRDIKPDNLFYLEGSAVIGDFGLVDYPGKQSLTSNSERLGPLFYVAPEMMDHSDNYDPKPADVYSLAKTLWVLATGQHYPLQGELRIDIPQARLSTYVSNKRAEMLDILLEKATRHDPSARPTMGEFAAELSAWLTTINTSSLPDMAHLSARFLPLVTQANNTAAEYSAKHDSCRQLSEILMNFIKEIHQLLCTTTGLINKSLPQHGGGTVLNKYFQYPSGNTNSPTLLYKDTCYHFLIARTTTRGVYIYLYYGFVLEVSINGNATLLGGMAVDIELRPAELVVPVPQRKPKIVVNLSCSFPVGSAQQEVEVTNLMNDFRKSLPSALDIFADVIANPNLLEL